MKLNEVLKKFLNCYFKFLKEEKNPFTKVIKRKNSFLKKDLCY